MAGFRLIGLIAARGHRVKGGSRSERQGHEWQLTRGSSSRFDRPYPCRTLNRFSLSVSSESTSLSC